MDKCTLKKAIETRKQLSQHNNRKHLNDGPVVTSQTIASFDYEDDMDDAITLLDVPTITLHSHALQLFLTKSIDKGMIMAIRNLVCGACFGARLLPLEVIHSVQLHDTYVVLLLARLVFRIGSVHQVLLSTLLSVFVISRPQKGPSALPITRSQLLRVITNKTNQMSLAASMPTPRPIEIGLRHAYVNVEEIIGHALGMEPSHENVTPKYQRLMDSAHGRKCLCDANTHFQLLPVTNMKRLICCLTFWFDGWDPNLSMTKANKTPIWSGTITLIFASLQGQVMLSVTKLVASGPGKSDHTEVIQCLLDSIVLMQEQTFLRAFWVRTLLARALVYPSVLVITCDQPERRSIFGLLAGNSKLHACFGVSCNTSLLEKSLEACEVCVGKLQRYSVEKDYNAPCLKACDTCLHWKLPDIPGCHHEWKYKSVVDKHFPVDANAGNYFNTHASMITSDILHQAWEEAYYKWVILNTWTSKEVSAYFKVLTINDAVTTKFIDQGRRCRLALSLQRDENTVTDEAMKTELSNSIAKYPSCYTKPVPPPMWQLVGLNTLPEAVMHLAMGVVKSVSKFVHGWALARNKSPFLTEQMNFCINMHRKYCRIGWCPVATYSLLGKFPGWVADTFRTWWIWMPWLYSHLENDTFTYTPYVLPTSNPHHWNGLLCTKNLKSRAHPGYAKLNAEKSKAKVLEMYSLTSWPMTEELPGACAVTGKDLQTLVWHCHSLFKHLFAEPNTNLQRNAAECHVKMLLSIVTKLDRILHVQESMPNIYEVKYNFISLPRAVRLLDTYGSARNIQEGGVDGEGIVKQLRLLTPQGLKKHVARNLINAFHRDEQLAQFTFDVSKQLADTPDINQSKFATLHKTIYDVEQALDGGEAVVLSGEDLPEEEDIPSWDQFDTLSLEDNTEEDEMEITLNP